MAALTLWMGACSETRTPELLDANGWEAGTVQGDALAPTVCSGTRVVSTRVVVESHADLVALRCVREVAGLVSISGLDITDLGELEHLERADGLYLHDLPELTSLSGLHKLSKLGSSGLRISRNPKLVDLQGLESLQSLAGQLLIEHNAQLVRLDGLGALQTLSTPMNVLPPQGRLVIRHNPELTSLAALTSLGTVQAGLYVCGNPALTELLPASGSSRGRGLLLTVLYNASLNAEAARVLAEAIQADVHSKLAANGSTSDSPLATCPFRGDQQCDESSFVSGDFIETCEEQPCCELRGPTRLCADGTDDPQDCPQEAYFPN